MVSVIFEVWPHPDHRAGYLDWAAELKNELLKMDGFISIERFQSTTDPARMVSLSFWRDEEAVRRWRNLQKHREAQSKGRGGIFTHYRLRVCQVLRDYGMDKRDDAPRDSVAAHG
jgi:heme-degrading monooxygenase HmoA